MANGEPSPSALVAKVNLVMDYISLKVIFLLHFLVIVLALCCLQWLPPIYLYYNTFFFALLLWSIHTKERVLEPILMAAGIDVTAIALDIICILSVYAYPTTRWFPFSLAFIILNIVLRPLTSFVLVRLYFAKANRGELPLHQEIGQNGSTLTNAIRKVLFLDPMGGGGGDRRGVDPNGTYRAHVAVERKASAPLTSVKTIPNGPPSTPPMFPPPPVTSAVQVVEVQPTVSSSPLIESKQQQQSQFTVKPQTPTPQPRRQSEQQVQTPSLTSSPQMSRQSDLPAALPPSSSSMPIIPSILEQKEQKEKKSNPPTPVQSKRVQVQHSSSSESGSESDNDDAEAIPEPGNLQLSQQRHSHYTDPSTGETFQERMI